MITLPDKYQILSIVAPIAAPVAPATMLINILYIDMVAEQVLPNIALLAAAASGVGAEASGMIAAYVGVKAFEKRKFGLMLVAILAFLAYAVFMAVGISVSRNPTAMISTIIISIIAYLTVALLANLREQDKESAKEDETELVRMDKEAVLLDKQTKLTNAQTKAAIAGAGVQPVQSSVQLSSVQTVQPVQGNLNPDRLQITRELLARNPNATTRDVAAAIGAGSPSTGKAYRDAVLNENQ